MTQARHEYQKYRMPNKPSKPRNMVDVARALEGADQNAFPRALRVQIPRVFVALYEIRNNRGVGHVGGDVDPNRRTRGSSSR
jgi:hypothetical protein